MIRKLLNKLVSRIKRRPTNATLRQQCHQRDSVKINVTLAMGILKKNMIQLALLADQNDSEKDCDTDFLIEQNHSVVKDLCLFLSGKPNLVTVETLHYWVEKMLNEFLSTKLKDVGEQDQKDYYFITVQIEHAIQPPYDRFAKYCIQSFQQLDKYCMIYGRPMEPLKHMVHRVYEQNRQDSSFECDATLSEKNKGGYVAQM